MTRRTKKWLGIGLAAVFAAGIGFAAWWLQRPALPPGFASANGRLEATEVYVSPKFAGRLAEVLVHEGDLVTPGEVVARMDVRDTEANLRQAKAELAKAVANKNSAKAALLQKQAELAYAQAEYRRAIALVKDKYIPQSQADLATTKLLTARAAVTVARASISQSEADIKADQANVEAIQTDIDDSILKATVLGRVLYRTAEPGEVLSAGGRVLTLVDLTDVYMTVFLPTADAGKVTMGSSVRIVFDARPDIAIPAKVSFVSPEAQFTPKEVETSTEREKLMFRIKAQIDPKLLEEHLTNVKTGVPGVVYFRLNPKLEWPKKLEPPPGL